MTENPAQLEGAPLTETTAIIAAAVMSVGPMPDQNAWEQAVTDRAKAIAQFASPKSPVAQVVQAMLSPSTKVFTGTIVGGQMEQSSKRLFVILDTDSSRKNNGLGGSQLPMGQEGVRTDRTDTPAGAAMAHKVRTMKGQKVRVWVYMEPTGNPERPTSRVLKHIELV